MLNPGEGRDEKTWLRSFQFPGPLHSTQHLPMFPRASSDSISSPHSSTDVIDLSQPLSLVAGDESSGVSRALSVMKVCSQVQQKNVSSLRVIVCDPCFFVLHHLWTRRQARMLKECVGWDSNAAFLQNYLLLKKILKEPYLLQRLWLELGSSVGIVLNSCINNYLNGRSLKV